MDYFNTFFVAWFVATFEPFQNTITTLFNLIPARYTYLHVFRGYAACFKCLTFWITLCYTQNILHAIILSFLAYVIDRIMMSLKMYI